MKAAGEEPGVQAPVAGVAHGGGDLLPHAGFFARRNGRGARRAAWLASQQPSHRCGRQGDHRNRPHCCHPAISGHHRLAQRGEDELPQAAAGIDEAAGKRALFGRKALGRRADQNREAACARTRCAQYAGRQDQAPLSGHLCGQITSCGQQDRTQSDDAPGSPAVGHRAENRLHHAPDQLTDGERETDRRNAKAGMRVQRRDEQTHRLSCAHGDHEDRGRYRNRDPGGARTRCVVRIVHGRVPARSHQVSVANLNLPDNSQARNAVFVEAASMRPFFREA